MLNRSRLSAVLNSFSQKTIALLGDLFLDRYLEIPHDLHELSIETGLEAYQVVNVRNVPGALGTVLNNLTALGVGRLLPVTVIGDDGHGYDLLQSLAKLPVVDQAFVLRDPHRLTPTYTKPIRQTESGTWKELNRLDVRTREPLSSEMRRNVINALRRAFSQADGLIVLDQVDQTDCGVVHEEIRAVLIELASQSPHKPIMVDSRTHLHHFSASMLKGNRSEIMAAAERLGWASSTRPARPVPASSLPSQFANEPAVQAVVFLADQMSRPVFCTVGDQGVLVAHPRGPIEHAPGLAVEGPIDIVGAGDSATSAIMASLLSGASHREAAELANLVASITIQQLGTTGTATPAQIQQRYEQTCTAP